MSFNVNRNELFEMFKVLAKIKLCHCRKELVVKGRVVAFVDNRLIKSSCFRPSRAQFEISSSQHTTPPPLIGNTFLILTSI